MPLPTGEHLHLIQEYEKLVPKEEWPGWVHMLDKALSEELEEHEEPKSPRAIAHLKRRSLSPPKRGQRPQKLRRWQLQEVHSSESEASSGDEDQEEFHSPTAKPTGDNVVLPILKAMLGFHTVPPKSHGLAPLCCLTLRQFKVEIYLTGWEEGWPLLKVGSDRDHVPCVAVNCAAGLIAPYARLNIESTCSYLDLSQYTEFQSDFGAMPWPTAPLEEYELTCSTLQKQFSHLLHLLSETQSPNHAVWFFCKAGRHRSYAMLLAFLMWAGRVHNLDFMRQIVDPLRNSQLQGGRQVELKHWAEMPGWQQNKGWVAFGDFLPRWLHFLNREHPEHGWDQYGL